MFVFVTHIGHHHESLNSHAAEHCVLCHTIGVTPAPSCQALRPLLTVDYREIPAFENVREACFFRQPNLRGPPAA